MKWKLVSIGVALLVVGSLASWFQVGQRETRIYLPNLPFLQSVVESGGASGPQPPTGMRLQIPVIGVDAAIDRLDMDSHGQIESPSRWGDTGWYDRGPKPGDPGVSLVLGHLDSTTGPAVFFRLRELKAGSDLFVQTGVDSLHYKVASIESYSEGHMPNKELFVATGSSRLALVTCAGDFNPAVDRYDERLVVMADQVT